MLCDFQKIGERMVCSNPKCAQSVPIVEPSLSAAEYFMACQAADDPAQIQKRALDQLEQQEKYLGDKTKEFLAEHGITEEWYKAVKSRLGFAPTCDCPQRVEWLNQADQLVRGWKRRGMSWVRRHLFG